MDGKIRVISTSEARQEDEEKERRGEKPQFEFWVKVERLGDAIVPQELEIRFRDGRIERRMFDGAARWVRFTFTGNAEIESAELDPRRIWQLDQCLANNSRTASLRTAPAVHWLPKLLFWAQNALLWLTSLA